MGGRDHSCEGCGRGGFNDPDGVCECAQAPGGRVEEPRDEEWYHCSECGGVASPAEWEAAWVRERDRRKDDPDYQDPIEEWPATNWGLDDRMVCPHCGFDHADNDASMVDSVPPPAESPPVGAAEQRLARVRRFTDAHAAYSDYTGKELARELLALLDNGEGEQ